MNHCIKCGKEVPQGELFCLECSLNPAASLFDQPRAERHPAPPGRMQTPQPVKRQPVRQAPPPPAPKKKTKSNRGLIAALVIVSLLLVAMAGLQLWQYQSMQVRNNRLRAKEADLALRETEMLDLQQQLADTLTALEAANTLVADKEAEIQDLAKRLASSQSSQNQGAYDLSAKEQELARLEEENLQLLALTDDLQLKIDDLRDEITELQEQLTAAEDYKTKSDFLDTYVVFVENDQTNCYHTYDCTDFAKNSFWAYSRKLAEAQGFRPCPTCGGMP